MQPVPGPAPAVPGPATGARPQPPAVQRARELLDRLPGTDPAEQVATFDEVHRLLQDALSAVETQSRVEGSRHREGGDRTSGRPGGRR